MHYVSRGPQERLNAEFMSASQPSSLGASQQIRVPILPQNPQLQP